MTNLKRMILAFGLIAVILIFAIIIARTQQPPTIIKTGEVTMAINPSPDFSLELSIEHIETFLDRVASFAASATANDYFAGDVKFSASGLPPEITVTYFPSDTVTLGPGESKGCSIELGIPLNQALVGDYTIVVTATSTNYN